MVHSQPLLPLHVKVLVDMLRPSATTTLNIPVPTSFHTTLAEIVGSFAQWPLHLVNIEEEEIIKNSAIKKNKGKKQSGDQCDMSATGARPPFIDDDGLQPLGKSGKRLHNLIRRMPLDLDYFELGLDYDIFHHTNMSNIFVMIEDIKDLFTMDWLDVSIIQVFIVYAHQLCKDFEVNSIGFMCPTQFAKGNFDLNEDDVTAYIGNTMVTMKDKTFILAPYHQANHWLLLVLHASSRIVYVLDPLNCRRKIEVKQAVNMAFRTSAIQRGQRIMGNANWKYVKCPQQPDSDECGYCIMRFIYDICTKFHNYTSLDEAYQDTNAYSKDEIDEIRRLWIDYFVNECI
ncbi:PREDICTED: uncharacterized protein LOC109156354 [Ipomoea nil]|uniref:uncharacterized protein LOC109156354 n=1 Tax=Ipomoea nil TaxID=35883 RepID=UPI000900F855|nr:PREDICTED: uncharacterized protein LOC109156354 [Ipomoea nil]